MTREELELILAAHQRFLGGWPDGGRADLRGADLFGLVLLGADLRGADLSDANLMGADLRGAALQGANLAGANLQGASLERAVVEGADFSGADLRGASLAYTVALTRSNLAGAKVDDATALRVAAIVTNLDFSASSPAVQAVAEGLAGALAAVVAEGERA